MSSPDFPRQNPRPVLRPAGPPVRPVRPAPPAAASSGTGAIIITAVVCSVMASVATSLVVTRYWPAAVPAPAVSPADRTGKGTGRAGGGKAEVDKTAPAAAVSAPLTALMNQTVTCVEGILSELPGFVSKSNHNGLFGDLTKLDAAAHAIESDGETAATLKVYGAALDQAIKRAGQIAGRSSETPDSIDAAQGVEARLNDLKNQLP